MLFHQRLTSSIKFAGTHLYVCMYLFVYAGYFMYMAANEADVDLRSVNNTQ